MPWSSAFTSLDVLNGRRDAASVVPAGDLADALSGEERTAFRLKNAIVLGPLKLRHRTVERPIEISDCIFNGDIDLCYAEFKGTVQFADCDFLGHFNSGDRNHSPTLYRKNLLFVDCAFHGLASFNGACVEGNASFNGSQFLALAEAGAPAPVPGDVEAGADFAGMQVERNLICSRATFHRSASFNALQCHTGEFHNTQFLGEGEEIDFRSAVFRGNIQLMDPETYNSYGQDHLHDEAAGASQAHAAIPAGGRGAPSATGPVVKGRLNLRGFRCERRAVFCGAEFFGPVDCEDAVFGWHLDARKARFHDRVIFTACTCKGAGRFEDAVFRCPTGTCDSSAVDFRYAAFDALELSRATFYGTVNLGQVRIEEKLRLDEARFHARVFLYGAKMGSLVLLNDGYSTRAAPLLTDVCTTEPDMTRLRSPEGRDTEYRDLVATIHRRLRISANRPGAIDPVAVSARLNTVLRGDPHLLRQVLDYAFPFRFDGDDQPDQPRWWQRVNMMIWRAWPMASPEPDPYPRGLELAGCTFVRIQAGSIPVLSDALIRALVASQSLNRFSRDPYLQLEQCYRRTGDEEKANQVHVWGHLAMRHNALSHDGAVQWSWLRSAWDSILMYTGWGHQTSRIGLFCFLVLLAGLLYFGLSSSALQPKEAPGASAALVTDAGSASDAAPACGRDGSCWFQRGEYTANAFLPAVSLGTRDTLMPASDLAEGMRLGLVIAGWVLIPLWAGSFAAVARRE